ncbi:MAG: thiamine pyrophosphate-dependent enzyme, partial [Thermodesulfovibrionales bacterium]|nr:thiamine pyrophosphate-dependent enzyme [Thermodesulfovibrionales bacterium]
GGDGGTYDIGLQALSGAMERGHNLLYICYDNGAYMNTGIQRSSATPLGADTTTCPAGTVIPGKLQQRKDLTKIMADHGIPYVAQAAISHWSDLMRKVKKALDIRGPKFMNILAPCNRGWRSRNDDAVLLSRLAVDTCYWPLYEIEDGILRITVKPKEKKPLEEFLKPQGRFKHLFSPENEWLLKKAQEDVDRYWERLLREEACFTTEKKEEKTEETQ